MHSLIVRDPDNPQLDVTPLSLLEVSEPAVMVDTSGQGSLSPHSPGGESSALQSVSKSGPGSGWGSSGASTPTRMEEGEGLDGEAELTSDNNKRASMPHVTMLQDEFPTKPAEIQREKEREITVILVARPRWEITRHNNLRGGENSRGCRARGADLTSVDMAL